MHPSVLRGIHRPWMVRVRGSLHRGIHARESQNVHRHHPCGGLLSDCRPPSGDDREVLHGRVARLRNLPLVRGEGDDDQNGSSWDRWL